MYNLNRENSEQLAWGLVNKQMKCFQLAPTEGGGGGSQTIMHFEHPFPGGW